MNAISKMPTPFDFQDYTILIIDDNPTNLSVITDYLGDLGFEIMAARDGQSCIEMAQYTKPDIILLDVMMPGIDGFETCRRLKTSEITQEIPVIFMTALTSVEDKVKGFESGAVDYITKPIQYKEMLARVTTHLSIRDLTHKLQEKNQALSQMLENLKATQNQLVESEKMAALGGLVAGVAHEINTPIGICVTASSLLEQQTSQFVKVYESGKMKRSALIRFIDDVRDNNTQIFSNLNRSAELIRSFKQVAVDQSSEEQRIFNVKAYLEEILLNLKPKLKRTQHQIQIHGDNKLCLNSYPGAFSQIITNFVINSLLHGYDKGKAGLITINFQSVENQLILQYQDDGKGMHPDVKERIFEPFFTTKRTQGGSGLGLHIVFNLVTQRLKGQIRVESQLEQGTTFTIELPLQSK